MNQTMPYRVQCYVTTLPDAADINPAIVNGFEALREDTGLERSHWFGGRYENIYVPEARLPALKPVLAAARRGAADYLGRPDLDLAVGFWLNAMGPGQVTLAHRHDEDDELVSGVYYVQVPENSGELVLTQGAVTTRVTPVAGQFVFFPPNILHEVTVNRSDETRLSIGMNFGIRG
jgi:2OG-Fe(II) oxygenase superfamily